MLAACGLSFLADRNLSLYSFLPVVYCALHQCVFLARSVAGLLFPVLGVLLLQVIVVFQVVLETLSLARHPGFATHYMASSP